MKRIILLVVLLIAAIAGGLWLKQQSTEQSLESDLLFADLQSSANDIQSIEITNAQGHVLKAEKNNDDWSTTLAPVHHKYPVDKAHLADLLLTLSQVKLVEAKTTKAANYFHLGLQGITNTDSLANLVTVKTAKQEWSVLVGNTVSFTDGSYVRKPNSKQSWRTDKSILLPLDHFAWLKQPILPFDSSQLLSVKRIDQSQWQIIRDAQGQLSLHNMPANSRLEYQTVLDAMLDSLTGLQFDEIRSEQSIEPNTLTLVAELAVQTNDEQRFTVKVLKQEQQHYVKFEHATQQPYWHGGIYSVSTFSAQQLVKNMQDFLQQDESNALDSEQKPPALEEGESPN